MERPASGMTRSGRARYPRSTPRCRGGSRRFARSSGTSRTSRRSRRWRRRTSRSRPSRRAADVIVTRLAQLEEARLFSGEYDSGDAVVTVNAGAGGTDSQDWAEMLLRMEMRWAERRGMKVELKEVSPGEEAGIKSASFIGRGENAYGLFSAEKGVHRLVRISPFDSQSPPPHRLRRGRGGPARGGLGRRRDRAGRHPDRHVQGLRRGRPAREQDRLGGSHHPPPQRHRRAMPERALSVVEQATRR